MNDTYNHGNDNVSPTITFPYNGEVNTITSAVVCEAIHIHVKTTYNMSITDEFISDFFT